MTDANEQALLAVIEYLLARLRQLQKQIDNQQEMLAAQRKKSS